MAKITAEHPDYKDWLEESSRISGYIPTPKEVEKRKQAIRLANMKRDRARNPTHIEPPSRLTPVFRLGGPNYLERVGNV